MFTNKERFSPSKSGSNSKKYPAVGVENTEFTLSCRGYVLRSIDVK